jgi:hypothetical protein
MQQQHQHLELKRNIRFFNVSEMKSAWKKRTKYKHGHSLGRCGMDSSRSGNRPVVFGSE